MIFLAHQIKKGGACIMKKIKKLVEDKRDALAIKVAKHYANVSCPLITFQSKLPDEVIALRTVKVKH